jgi:tetraacyldisaccharide 4'-kinase
MKLFISKLHYEKNPNLFHKAIITGLSLFAIPYNIVISVRNFLYDKNILKCYDTGVLTIAVGNLTTGGVGKTPFTAELANYYVKQGKKVAILSRGYGGLLPNKEVNVISDGEKINFSAKYSGDEPYWLATNCPSVVVLTCSSRFKAGEKAVKDYNCDVLIADDAFQHRKLKRDINLMLIDQANKFGNNRILPAGPLRENFSGINRASAIIVTNKTLIDENALKYCDELKEKYQKPVFLCKMIPSTTYDIKDNEKIIEGTNVIAFCAIGQPKEFYDFVNSQYVLKETISFPDHHAYDQDDIQKIVDIAKKNNVNTIITTEKDAVKIKYMIANSTSEYKFFALKLVACADFDKILDR